MSVTSALLLTPAEYEDDLQAALITIAENTLYAFVDPSDAESWEEATLGDSSSGPHDWLRAVVDFSGRVAGQVEVTFSAALGRELCASFAGLETQDMAPDDVDDFAGEFAYVVCGTWLKHTWAREAFVLTPPSVAHLAGTTVRAAAPASAAVVFLRVNDAPVRLILRWSVPS